MLTEVLVLYKSLTGLTGFLSPHASLSPSQCWLVFRHAQTTTHLVNIIEHFKLHLDR